MEKMCYSSFHYAVSSFPHTDTSSRVRLVEFAVQFVGWPLRLVVLRVRLITDHICSLSFWRFVMAFRRFVMAFYLFVMAFYLFVMAFYRFVFSLLGVRVLRPSLNVAFYMHRIELPTDLVHVKCNV